MHAEVDNQKVIIMMEFINNLPAGILVLIAIILLLNAVMWLFLPFAIYGMKPRIDEVIKQLKLNNSKMVK